MSQKIMLEARKINKTFGTVHALKSVDFTLHCGEIHGLIGENGSGKSTLSSIIAGVQPATDGEMFLKGEPYQPAGALEANAAKVNMLLQERGTFNSVSVSANIFVGKEDAFTSHGYLNIRKQNEAGRKALDAIGATDISEKELTGRLSFENQKIVEIARAMENDPDILIVDETTTALSRKGRDLLYELIRKMKAAGKSVIFISHDIDEVKEICDALTVLRDGEMIQTLEKAEFTDSKIRQLMVGRDIGENFYRADSHATCQDGIVLKAEHIHYGQLKDVSLELKKGEILGIGGLTDCGMHDLGKILFGAIRPDSGSVSIENGKQIRTPGEAVKNNIAYVAKDRDTEALMTSADIMDNICAPSYKKMQKFGFITGRNEKKFAAEWAKKLNVKMSGLDQMVMQLSGGNKQKVSVAKWIGYDADIFIFDCPTRGIDIGVKAAIYQLMMEMKAQGKSIVMISEELMEVIGMSDRIAIIKNGEVSGTFKRDDNLTESKLIEYII